MTVNITWLTVSSPSSVSHGGVRHENLAEIQSRVRVNLLAQFLDLSNLVIIKVPAYKARNAARRQS